MRSYNDPQIASRNVDALAENSIDSSADAPVNEQAAPDDSEDFECPNNGIFADEPSGCQAYHVCQSGAQVQQKFQCPMGTLFNNIILTCDFAHNVQCGKTRQSSSATSRQAADQARTMLGDQEPTQARAQPQQSRPATSYRAAPQPTRQSPRVQTNSGPRQLVIGNNHRHASIAHQRAPSNQPSAIPTDDTGDSASESDDEPPAPLLPAVLPVRTASKPADRQQVLLASQLPYNPPPPAQHLGHQSAHRSQYPAAGLQKGNYDVASVVTPFFVDQDEEMKLSSGRPQPAEPAKVAPAPPAASGLQNLNAFPTPAYLTTPTGNHPSQPEQSGFNLVINHGAPTQIGSAKAQVGTHEAPLADGAQPNQKPVSSQRSAGVSAAQRAGSLAKTPMRPSAPSPAASAKAQQQPLRHPMSSQPKPVHVDGARKPTSSGKQDYEKKAAESAGARPGLVELTSNKQQVGVSSDAINDGLLLIVRHAGSGGAHSSARAKADESKAYAVDPAIVRPDSPIDAQLFPNVQGVLAGVNQAPDHQSSSTMHYVQHVAADQPPTAKSKARPQVSPPLIRLDPPKPVLDSAGPESSADDYDPANKSGSQQQQPKQSSSSPNQQAVATKNRNKRTKRLKAAQPPAARPSAPAASSATSMPSKPESTQPAAHHQSQLVSQADQPVNIVEDRNRSARLNIS